MLQEHVSCHLTWLAFLPSKALIGRAYWEFPARDRENSRYSECCISLLAFTLDRGPRRACGRCASHQSTDREFYRRFTLLPPLHWLAAPSPL